MVSQGKVRVGIFGGGITGLTVAYYLQKEIIGKGLNVEYRLFEESNRLGGKIQTDYSEGFVIEKGPDSFLARKQSAARLAKEVGLEKELVHNDTGQSFILKDEKLFPMPGGSIMGIPTQLTPFVTTKLFSPIGKLRAAGDLFIPKTNSLQDQSLGQFFRKRMGNEVVDYLIEPLLSGIYAGDIDKLSLKATFPQFHQVEQKYGSLILGMKKSMPKQPKSPEPKKPKGMFMSFKRGLQSFIDGIENHLDADSIVKNIGVKKINKVSDGYEVTLTNGEVERFDRVILTTPHHITHKVLEDYPMVGVLDQDHIPSTSVATIAMAFPLSQVKGELQGTGFVVAKKGDYNITACTWTHKKWKHSAPQGYGLLRCYVGRFGDDAIVDESDEYILNAVLKDLKNIMEIDGEPTFHRITRWKHAMPQYLVGHKDRIQTLKQQVKEQLPGLYIAGAAFEGLGLPDCIDQGEAVVKELLESVK